MAEINPPIRRPIDVLTELVALDGRRVVDVGCGDGAIVRALTRLGALVTGIEIDAGQLAPALAAPPAGTERYLEGRGEALPLPDASVDLVLYFNSLHHVPVPDQGAALQEAGRVLAPGGALLVVEPLAEGDWFELVRPVEDETIVRAAAYTAIQAAGCGAFVGEREVFYRTPLCFADYGQVEARIRAVDPSRSERLTRLRPALMADFATRGEQRPDGRHFYQPSRANLLRRR